MKIIKSIILLVLVWSLSPSNLYASDWDDLWEGEKEEVYGSEKSKKYPVSNLLWEKEKWEGHYAVKIFWLYKYTDYPKYNSTRFFPLYNRIDSKIDNRESFRFINYTYQQEKSTIDRSIFPLVFWGTDSKENSNYNGVFPLYSYKRVDNPNEDETTFGLTVFPFYYTSATYQIHGQDKHYKKLHWSLLHYKRTEEDKGEFNEFLHSDRLGFPLIPFLYYSSYDQGIGSSKRIFTLFAWENNSEKEMQSVSFFPLFAYRKKDYFSLPILLFHKDLSAPTAAYGKTFFPLFLHYHKWDPAHDTTVFGPYISTYSEVENTSFQTFFPIYWKSTSEKRDWSAILPLYFNYNDKENDYNINLIWMTRSNSGQVKPELRFGKKDDKWYIDTDLTILYYLLSFSFRDSIETPKFFRTTIEREKSSEELAAEKIITPADKKEENPPEKENENPTEEEKSAEPEDQPKLVHKKEFNRENSLKFRGYSALFNLISYEAADTKRHFRFIPLSWLTWDEASDDKIVIVPPFPPLVVWYKSEELEYNVILPFYGRQKDEDSEKKAYFLNGYITESYKEENRQEKSVLWPLFNYYTINSGSGHRLLPFYIHKTIKNENSETNNNYTLFSFYNSNENNSHNSKTFFFWPLLIYYDKDVYLDPASNREDSNLWLTPFFYRGSDNWSSHTNIFWLYDWKFHKQPEGDSLDYILLFPFFYTKDFYAIIPFSFTKVGASSTSTFTLLNYYHSDQYEYYYNFLYLLEFEKSKTDESIETNLLFYLINFRNTVSTFKFEALWGLGWKFRKWDNNWNEISILSWLGAGYRYSYGSTTYNLSLLMIDNSSPTGHTNWFLGNYWHNSSGRFRNNFLFLVDYKKDKETNLSNWDFLFTSIHYHNYPDEFKFYGIWDLAWNFHKLESSGWRDASVMWIGYETRENYTIHNYLPIIRLYDSNYEQSRIYGPMLLYTSENQNSNLHLGALGAGYWHYEDKTSKERETYILLGALYREFTKKERGYSSKGSLWGWLWEHQKEEETGFEKYSLLKLFSYTKEVDGSRKIIGIPF